MITRIGVAAAVLALSACASPTATMDAPRPAGPAAYEAVVSRVVDGDTVVVRGERSPAETVRVLAIDTPETKDPRKPVQCWGPEATAFASVTLLNQQVHLVPDPTQDATDRYGRTLAYVELAERNQVTGAPAGSDYSTLAADAGVARSYVYRKAHPPQRITQIQAAEERAHVARRGIWGSCVTN